jgi:MoxR-like ATPase
MELTELRATVTRLQEQIGERVIGQEGAVDLLVIALLARGHALIEGMPGTAKTMLAQCFATSLALDFKRVQFTPDLMPGDVTGVNLFEFQSNEFRLIKGPIFTQILLADEINRTPPKTQAALLQAMQEREVTIDGTTHELGDAFTVVATQNPIEQEGTYPLPEAQLDRFLVKILIDYPSREAELEMASRHGHLAGIPDLQSLEPIADLDWIRAARDAVSNIEASSEVQAYIVDLARATREHAALSVGASPRSINMMCLATRAMAAIRGRDYVIPDDVKELIAPVLAHRIVLAPGAELEGLTSTKVLRQVVEQVTAPR